LRSHDNRSLAEGAVHGEASLGAIARERRQGSGVLQRRQIAAEEGAKAMADTDQRAAAIRQNMARLRALRLAKEAEDAMAGNAAASAPSPKRRKKALR
jgi:hypothetical protein